VKTKQATSVKKNTKAVKTEVVEYSEVPLIFMEETGYTLADYSVGLGYYDDEKATIPQIFGSGVFVTRGNRFGILTAHHCIHPPGPNLNLGNFGGHRLALITKAAGKRYVIVPPEIVQKHALGVPDDETNEPDLAFIEISQCPFLDSLKAMVSFWPLTRKNLSKAKRLKKINMPFTVIGFPGHYQKRIAGTPSRLQIAHKAYFYSIIRGGVSKRNDWDYVTANNVYYEGHTLPPTFAGVSGGPVWALEVHGNRGDLNFVLADFCLVGIAFFQIPLPNSGMQIKAHFMDSIYSKAWE
jgi:hypothetical protein